MAPDPIYHQLTDPAIMEKTEKGAILQRKISVFLKDIKCIIFKEETEKNKGTINTEMFLLVGQITGNGFKVLFSCSVHSDSHLSLHLTELMNKSN